MSLRSSTSQLGLQVGIPTAVALGGPSPVLSEQDLSLSLLSCLRLGLSLPGESRRNARVMRPSQLSDDTRISKGELGFLASAVKSGWLAHDFQLLCHLLFCSGFSPILRQHVKRSICQLSVSWVSGMCLSAALDMASSDLWWSQ